MEPVINYHAHARQVWKSIDPILQFSPNEFITKLSDSLQTFIATEWKQMITW